MRLAILSDIHGNREAFAAVLADVAARGADRIVLLGDLVGYGPDPEWCVDRAAELVAAGAIAVMGNHDSGIARPEAMSTNAQKALDWTRPRLSEGQRGFLAGLPLTAVLEDMLFVHASANDPAGWNYVTADSKAVGSFQATKARLIFCGHVHVPLLVSADLSGQVREQRLRVGLPVPLLPSRRWLAVVGSVGQPRDRSPHAAYATLDLPARELTFRRAPYDCGLTATKVRAAGLPEALALRLLNGD